MRNPAGSLCLFLFWSIASLSAEVSLDGFPPKGMDCLTGIPDSNAPEEPGSGESEVCFVAPNGHILLNRSATSQGYRVTLQAEVFSESECRRLESAVHNCINVLPGRSKNYVEAALGLDMPDRRNVFHWLGDPATSANGDQPVMSAEFIFDGDLLVAMEVINIASPDSGGSP